MTSWTCQRDGSYKKLYGIMVMYGGNIFVEWTLNFIFSEPYYESVSDYEEIQEVEHFPASASPDSDD